MRWATILCLAMSVGFVAGCGKGDFSQRQTKATSDSFRYPIFGDPTTLDPAMVQDGDTIDLLQQVFEGLTAWGTDNKPVPNLAEKWDISPNGTLYTFHLKHGVKFHNGDEVKADDVKYSFDRACDKALGSPVASNYMNDIVGAVDAIAGKAKGVAGVKVVDPYTVTIQIDKPRPYFLGKLTYPCAFVVSKKVALMGKEIRDIKSMVGTGPFKVTAYSPQQSLTLERFSDYHGGTPKVAKIERPIIKDAATRLNKFKNGEIDLCPLARQDVVGIQNDPALKDQLKFFDRPSLYYLGLNQGAYAPFKDKRVRQAFAMAVDRERIVSDNLGNVNKLANSILPPGVVGFRDSAKALAYNPTKAKELLAQAGFPGGKGLPPLTIYFRDGQPDVRIVAEAVTAQIKQNLGIDVSTRMLEWKTYLDKNTNNKLEFFHMRWAADYLDPQNFLSLLLASYGSENHVGYNNPAYDQLCSTADTTLDEAKRLELYAKAEDIVLDDSPFIPVYFQRDAELISPRVQGLRESAFGHLPHTTVEIR